MLTRLAARLAFLLDFVSSTFHRAGLSPNQISVLGFFLTLISSSIYIRGISSLPLQAGAALTLLASGFLDAVDGAMARKYGSTTPFGKVLDSFLDRLSELLVYASMIIASLVPSYLGLAALGVSFLISYVNSVAEAVRTGLKGVGILERPERILILAASTLLGRDAIFVGIYIIVGLGCLTVLQRLLYVRQKTATSSTLS